MVTNAIVTWNTVYMNAAIERLRAEGRIGRDIDLGHLSPALYGHVNPYGKYRFEIEAGLWTEPLGISVTPAACACASIVSVVGFLPEPA